jgi:transcription factor SFP1
MAGTSPSAFQQPSSFQSSSYLPKMEASFFKDYWCCNIMHASLHDLMQHMEECHGAQTQQPISGQAALSFTRQPTIPSAQPTHKAQGSSQTSQPSGAQVTRGFQTANKSTLATIQDDPLDSMDFDEPSSSNIAHMAIPNSTMAQQSFRSPPVTTGSQPFSLLSSNPTVSSVNTPTLSTITQPKHTPDSSIPSTPHATNMTNFDTSLDMFGGFQDVNGIPLMTEDFGYGHGLEFGALPNNLGGLTIHDPAKQLTSKNGTLDNSQMQFAFNNGQLALDDDLARALNQQQFPGGIPASALGFPGHEEKKYKCPVIGCEKAYKNQNGLKYHKQVCNNPQTSTYVDSTDFEIAWSYQPKTQAKPRRFILHCGSSHFCALPWNRRNGKGKALPMRKVR